MEHLRAWKSCSYLRLREQLSSSRTTGNLTLQIDTDPSTCSEVVGNEIEPSIENMADTTVDAAEQTLAQEE